MCGDACRCCCRRNLCVAFHQSGDLWAGAHATHFIMLPALAGIVLLQNLEDSTSAWRIFSAGLLLGLAVIMKQTGVAFGLFAAVWVAWCELSSGNRRWGRLFLRLGWLALGGVLPFALMCWILNSDRRFQSLLVLDHPICPSSYLIFPPGLGMIRMPEYVGNQCKAAPGLWGLAVAGGLLLFCKKSCNAGDFLSSASHFSRFSRFVPVGISEGIILFKCFQPAGLLWQ